MLLKKLSVTNSRGSVMDLPLDDTSGGFLVKEIQGLGPVKAMLVSSSFANMDGEQYYSSRRVSRNIIVKLGLTPDYSSYSVYDLRAQLYEFFMPKSKVKLNFSLFDKFKQNIIEQNLNVEIDGRIEYFEPEIFTKEPTVDLSLMCFDPDFIVPEPVIFEGSTVSDLTETMHDYVGTVETGVKFTIFVNRNLDDFTIYHRPPDEVLKAAYFTHPLVPDDKLEINSVFGEKRVILTRGGVESSLLYALSPQSNWLEFSPGENNIRVYSDGAAVPYEFEYTTKYGGL